VVPEVLEVLEDQVHLVDPADQLLLVDPEDLEDQVHLVDPADQLLLVDPEDLEDHQMVQLVQPHLAVLEDLADHQMDLVDLAVQEVKMIPICL
jgi:hypothetical protein